MVTLRINRFQRLFRTYFLKFRKTNDVERWNDSSQLLSDWASRNQLISSLIPNGLSIIDCGAGKMTLKKYLKKDCKYTPLDIVDRGNGTIICDLNSKVLPILQKYDVAVVSGVLEYIYDIPNLIRYLSKSVGMIVISYSPSDTVPKRLDRLSNGWVNDYSTLKLKQMFELAGFDCDNSLTWKSQIICRFVKTGKAQDAH